MPGARERAHRENVSDHLCAEASAPLLTLPPSVQCMGVSMSRLGLCARNGTKPAQGREHTGPWGRCHKNWESFTTTSEHTVNNTNKNNGSQHLLSTYYVPDAVLINLLYISPHVSHNPHNNPVVWFCGGEQGRGAGAGRGVKCMGLSDEQHLEKNLEKSHDNRKTGVGRRRESQRLLGPWISDTDFYSPLRTDRLSDCPAGCCPLRGQKCPHYISSFFCTLKHTLDLS